MALTPWPGTPAALAAALACLRAAGVDAKSDDRLGAIGAAASAMVEMYAPGAPESLREEAVIRFCGYLSQAGFGAIATEDIGTLKIEHVTNHAAAFRNSGAAALLSRWRVRRAGAIG